MTRQVFFDRRTGIFRYPASPWARWYAALIVGASLLLLALLAGGCSTINVCIEPQPVGSGPLTVNIEQSKTLTGSLPVGDSAIATAKKITP
jgi:hypothetical protein